MEAGLREEQPTPPPADSPQRHNSALSNAGCSSGAGASDVATSEERIERQWAELHDVLEGRAPIVRSAAYIERSDRVFAWQEELRARYAAMPFAQWFRDAHEGGSLGPTVGIDE